MLMLVAALIYSDGILTLIRMASLYATERGLGREVVLGTFLAIQFVGIPCAMAFGQLARRFGAKRMILVGLCVYAVIPVLAYVMSSPVHFVLLGLLVALVQGGTQALTRSLFSTMVPRHKTGEFFAFFSLAEKFAGVMGQACLTALVALTGSLAVLDPLRRVLLRRRRRGARARGRRGGPRCSARGGIGPALGVSAGSLSYRTKNGLDHAAPPSSWTTRT
jgi:MFS-type transporter involved in bile tolerance (Atg22 family)